MGKHAFQAGSIHVIESLQASGELRTGERLFEELEPLAITSTPTIEAYLWRESTREGLLARLQQIAEYVRRSGRAPVLHIEAHGLPDGSGLQTASGETLTWLDLKEPLTVINVLCRLNLLVLLSACDGEGLTHVIQLTDRAPLWGLIGPSRSVSAGEIEDGNLAFYKTLLSTRDGGTAWRAMNETATRGDRPFRFRGAATMFRLIMQGYFAEYCTEEALDRRSRRVMDEFERIGTPDQLLPQMQAAVAEYLRRHSAQFEEIKTRFFFIDLCPENFNRFPISFDDCFGAPRERELPTIS